MTPPAIRSATLVVNPFARNIARFDRDRALGLLAARGIEAHLAIPESFEASVDAARSAAQRGDDLLFAVGGDGSLRAAAEGVRGTQTAIAAVPAGTTNVWAREVRLPLEPHSAIATHLAGEVVAIDCGLANGSPFVLMAGIGWDAAVVRRTNGWLKRRTGPLAYGLEAFRQLPAMRPRWTAWTADDAPFVDGLGQMVIGNTRLYGGLVEFTPDALAADGFLDVCAFCPRHFGDGLCNGWRLVRGALEANAAVRMARVAALTIETRGLHVQLDGDYFGTTPTTFSVVPKALRVSIPAGPPPPIVSG